MEENMADAVCFNGPSTSHLRLYERWGAGGAGLIISGHIMIDPTAMASPGDIVLAEDAPIQSEERWRAWVKSTQHDGAQFWLQINHPGRQKAAGSGFPAYAPSPIPIDIGRFSSMFEKPLEMTEEHIQDVIRRFQWTARKAEELGISGVEIHAAHGYLLSQFLSPRTNQRTDRWGGSLENRSRLLFAVIEAVRGAVSSQFGVGVKINSADFQRGGFGPEDLRWVVQKLNLMKVDFIELSGGSVESPAMQGSQVQEKKSESTIAREAYFVEAARMLTTITEVPLIVTGGIIDRETVDTVLDLSDNILAGIATGLGLMPDLPNRWASGENPRPRLSRSWVLSGLPKYGGSITCVQWNLLLIGNGWEPWPGVWPLFALVVAQISGIRKMAQYKRWIGKQRKVI